MKTAVVFVAVAVYGAAALSLPTLAWVNSTAQKAISKGHDVNDQTIQLVDSTNQAMADYVKDGAETGTLWMQDGMDKVGDKTKDAMNLAQDTTNKALNIMGQLGGPLKWGAAIGSKLTNITADAGKTMMNVAVGAAQLGTAAGNQAMGAWIDMGAGLSSGVAGKATTANDVTVDLASAGVNKAVKVTSAVGKEVGSAIESVGKGIYNWFKGPLETKNANVEVNADVNVTV